MKTDSRRWVIMMAIIALLVAACGGGSGGGTATTAGAGDTATTAASGDTATTAAEEPTATTAAAEEPATTAAAEAVTLSFLIDDNQVTIDYRRGFGRCVHRGKSQHLHRDRDPAAVAARATTLSRPASPPEK